MKNKAESGIALATALIVLFLIVALVVGFSWMVLVDQKLGGVNGEEQYAFYGAEAGLEKLTSNLGFLFSTNPAPSTAQVNALDTAATTPAIPGIQYIRPDGTLGYQIAFPIDPVTGNPLAQTHTILSGPFQGMTGLLTPFTLTATARNIVSGAEVKLQRNVQTVAIPVFQFGMFSQTDLSYFPGPNFNFGGRVHTNGNLFLAEGGGNNLILGDKVTAAGDIVRAQLSNGLGTPGNYDGNVYVPTTAGGCPAPPIIPAGTTASCWQLQQNEGSVVGAPGSAATPLWPSITARYHGYLQSKVKPLNLGITLSNNTFPIDLIRRGLPNENTTNPSTLAQRYYSEASVRILLSDNIADITGLPCQDTSVLPTALTGSFGGAPIATSGATGGPNYSASDGYWTAVNTPVLGNGDPTGASAAVPRGAGALSPTPNAGYIKIEIQTAYAVAPNPCGTWKDVTAQVLGLGIAGRNLAPGNYGAGNYGDKLLAPIVGGTCPEPDPLAIVRLERIRDNPSTGPGNICGAGSANATDYWPNALFDTREGNARDVLPANPYNTMPTLGGVVDYTELDIANLANYLTADPMGQLAKDNTNSSYDFVVYFSDRRGNYTPTAVPGAWPPASPTGTETGEYGFDDSINYSQPWGCPDGVLDQAETFDEVENPTDVVGGTPQNYGAGILYPFTPVPLNPILTNPLTVLSNNPNCAAPPISAPSNVWPGMYVKNFQEARENAPLFFRRALKIVNGSNINLGVCPDGVNCGLTIVSENPVYVKGDFNNGGAPTNFSGHHVATSVVADAVTLLSNSWNDVNSFISPYTPGGRNATTTTYRFGVVAGKGLSFPLPGACGGGGCYQDFGTDGGVHNFLRFLENWSGQSLDYRGSIISFYYNRQAIGVYKCCTTVYSPPTRGYNFDSEFLTPSLLPPRTPLFRDVNTIGFTQTVLPTN